MVTRNRLQPLLLAVGVAAYAFGISQVSGASISRYGLLASASPVFILGLAAVLAAGLLELRRREPRPWLTWLQLAALVVAIHASVPIVFGTPEYAWVYKHIGVAQALGLHGRVTNSSDIYQQWPVLFSAVAAVGSLSHVSPMTFSTWAPLAFELADAFVLLAIFRLLVPDRRIAYLAVLLDMALVSWVGQDYLSPQAFAYLLWLGMMLVILKWLRTRAPRTAGGRLARLRAPLLAGYEAPEETAGPLRWVALVLVAVIYFAIVAAHQLTPYVALATVGVFTLLDLVRPRWLVWLLAVIAIGYLVPRYGIIADNFGGLFSGANPIQNASGTPGTFHAGPEATTALIVRGLAAFMWIAALVVLLRHRRRLGALAPVAALAFSPFVILFAQRYGGEAIYRIYLFSAPWCALLIARGLWGVRSYARRWALIGVVSLSTLFAGVQGLYGRVPVSVFSHGELAASRWLYAHVPERSLIVLPVDDFPVLQTAHYDAYELEVLPADPQNRQSWLNEADLGEVDRWLSAFHNPSTYVVFSRTMRRYVEFFGAPKGYYELAAGVRARIGWTAVFQNADTTIYRARLG